MHLRSVLVAATVALVHPGCRDDEPPTASLPVPTHLATVQVAGWTLDVPDGWVTEEPRSRSAFFPRLLQIRLPGDGGTGDAELIAVKSTGTTEANLDRWKKQFDATDEERARWREETFEAGGASCTLLEVHGTHTVPMFSREEGHPDVLPGHAMLGAIWSIDPAIAFRALGPAATIERHEGAFRAFLASARR